MSPMANAQQNLIVWFERYFAKFGDKAPNRKETELQIMAKTNVYEQYCREMRSIKADVVSISVFDTIWITLFPRCVNRPWCDIPGKCETCYEIDRLRRVCKEDAALERLKQAHHLHRGGLFMLERLS